MSALERVSKREVSAEKRGRPIISPSYPYSPFRRGSRCVWTSVPNQRPAASLEDDMSTRKSCAFALLLALGCSSQSKTDPANEASGAGAALQAISVQDEQKVAQCGHAVTLCEQQLPDAAPPAAVCERLAQHCTELQLHLSEVREHAVGCLNGVLACQEHAPEQAACSRDLVACEPLQAGAEQDRATVVACSDKVEACLTRIASLPEAAAGSCDNLAAACERVNALVAQTGRERAVGDEHANEHAQQAHDAMQGVDADDDADDAADDVDDADDAADDADDADDVDDEGQNQGNERADAGAGKSGQSHVDDADDLDD